MLVIAILSLTACNDDFLERFPTDSLSNETFWNSEADFKAYTLGLYESVFDGAGITIYDDNQSDNQAPNGFNEIAAGQYILNDEGETWDWSFLRSCNFFLENYNKNPDISDATKNQYKGEVLLLRSIFIANRVKRYGDIPFSTKLLDENSPELYEPRTSRIDVMAQVLSDLTFAGENMSPTVSEVGRLSKWAALAFKARICLHEGTFRKYHGIAGADEFIQAAADASEQVIASGAHALYSTGNPETDYIDLFKQEDLAGNSEAIYFEQFALDKKSHTFIRFMPGIGTDPQPGLSKDMVNDYLCTDGQPIGLSALYQGDDTLADEFTDRDPRMAQTILAPSPNEGEGYWFGFLDETVPRLSFASGNGSQSTTGYHVIKHNSNEAIEASFNSQNTDLHIIRYAEVLLIYAEAKAELGQADQGIIDQTINLLRARVGMAPMVIADLQRDPNSDMVGAAGFLDADVSVLIEEIRRERRVELAGEGFRYDDLMRWRAGKFMTKPMRGAKWAAFVDLSSELYGGISAPPLDTDGYMITYPTTIPDGGVFDPNKHYFFPIPLGEITLNPALVQNPGWGN